MFIGQLAAIGLAVASLVAALPAPVQLPYHRMHQRRASRRQGNALNIAGTLTNATGSAVNSTLGVLVGPGSGSSVTNTTITIGDDPGNAPATSSNSTNVPQGGTKFVLAHFMVGNAYSMTVDTWKSDISIAQNASIDGFALNIGSDPWQWDRVADAYTAAEQLGTNFKMCISFDMTVLPQDGGQLQKYITAYASHPNQFMYNGKVFASTFSGESSFGGPGGWMSNFIQPLQSQGINVWFVPALFVPPGSISGDWADVVSGYFNWNSGWVTTVTSQSLGITGDAAPLPAAAVQTISQAIGSLDPDQQFISALASGTSDGAKKSYMASISPTFFTHYGADSYNKNWLYMSDDHVYGSRWETLIQNRDQIDIAEIVTWNDYGESSYIGPIGQDQPNSQAWVDGFDHQEINRLTAYYATAFKTGTYPAVTSDSVVLSARPHAKDAVAVNDPVGKPTNWEMTSDNLYADLLLTAPAAVTLSSSDSQTQTFQAEAGVQRFSIPLTVGGYISATIERGGQTVLTCKPSNYTFIDNPETYNFNYFIDGCSI